MRAMSHPPQSDAQTLQNTVRHLLTVTTTLLVLCVAGVFIHYFYSLAALLSIVLIVTYLLLGPVNLMELLITAFSKTLGHQLPGYRSFTKHSPDANPRILAVLIVYFVFFMTLIISSMQLTPLLSKQLGDLGSKAGTQLMEISDRAIDWADENVGKGTFRSLFAQDIQQAERQGLVKKHAPADMPVTQEEKQVIHQSVLQTTLNQLQNAAASALPNFISLVGGTLNGFIYFLSGLLLTFYFLVEGHKLKKNVVSLLPPKDEEAAEYLLNSFHQVMFSFIKGQVLLGMLTGFYMFVVYSIFGVPYAFLLGVVFALAELLPVIGTWIGIIIGLTVILLNMDPIVAFWVWLCSYIYQTLKDNILAPKVVGDVMGLHPLVIILALLICAKIAGLLGILVALPLASAINVILRLLLQKDATEKLQATENKAAGGSHV